MNYNVGDKVSYRDTDNFGEVNKTGIITAFDGMYYVIDDYRYITEDDIIEVLESAYGI